ncbi:MAG: DUF6452 family protein [Flavobacterium sp.]
MKKLLKYSFVIAVVSIVFIATIRCEKDDICVSEVKKTPLLYIRFFDSNNTQNPKNVNNLRVIGTEFITTENHVPLLFNGVSEIKIPLKVNQDQTEFYFYLNAENTNEAIRNTDKVVINYSRNDIYISRACGYKTNFDLNILNPIEVSDVENVENYPNGTSDWIESVVIVNTEINQDEEPHIHIYF